MARYLNGATIMTTSTPRSLEIAREAGFDGIEARAERLLEDAAEFPVDRLAMVHLNDAPAKPPETVEDADRVLPGLGVIRLPELVAALRGRGYQRSWSLETFNPAYWEQDPATVATRGQAALDALLGAGI